MSHYCLQALDYFAPALAFRAERPVIVLSVSMPMGVDESRIQMHFSRYFPSAAEHHSRSPLLFRRTEINGSPGWMHMDAMDVTSDTSIDWDQLGESCILVYDSLNSFSFTFVYATSCSIFINLYEII
jgi:hypothetical protein